MKPSCADAQACIQNAVQSIQGNTKREKQLSKSCWPGAGKWKPGVVCSCFQANIEIWVALKTGKNFPVALTGFLVSVLLF